MFVQNAMQYRVSASPQISDFVYEYEKTYTSLLKADKLINRLRVIRVTNMKDRQTQL